MPRFFVLTHCHPKLHWDFMLEHEGVLRTWRLVSPPDTDSTISAELLDDHRIAYLDYEGTVSGDRGTVQRWDGGMYETLESTSRGLVLNLAGEKLVGVTPLQKIAGHRKYWKFWRLPPKGAD